MTQEKQEQQEEKTFDPPLDPGIERAVQILWREGFRTYESCEGGPGHTYAEPAVRFHGTYAEGFTALGVALYHGLPVKDLRRIWGIVDYEVNGPYWELAFWEKVPMLSNSHP